MARTSLQEHLSGGTAFPQLLHGGIDLPRSWLFPTVAMFLSPALILTVSGKKSDPRTLCIALTIPTSSSIGATYSDGEMTGACIMPAFVT